MERFRIWAVGCAHGGKDIIHQRESLLEAAKDAETVGFDVGVYLGDFSGHQGLPDDEEGVLYRDQLIRGMRNHIPEQIYPLQGNHDRTDQPGLACGEWFNTWMDPLCVNYQTSGMRPDMRPFPIHDGTWDAYEVQIGKMSIALMSDVNRPLTPLRGEGHGDPGGVVSPQAYDWWKAKCAEYRGTDRALITFAHYMPKDTTTATNEYGGGRIVNGEFEVIYHGAGATGGKASSYLGFVGEELGRPFIEHLEQHPGDTQMWIGAHNHVLSGKKIGGMGHIVKKNGCLFVQNGAATMYHHKYTTDRNPKSRIYEFENGSDEVRIHAIMHENVNGFARGHYSTKLFRLEKPIWI